LVLRNGRLGVVGEDLYSELLSAKLINCDDHNLAVLVSLCLESEVEIQADYHDEEKKDDADVDEIEHC